MEVRGEDERNKERVMSREGKEVECAETLGAVLIRLTLSRSALHALSSIAFLTRVTFVTVKSSPTTCVGSPMAVVISVHAAQSSWSKGSSMVMMGKSLHSDA